MGSYFNDILYLRSKTLHQQELIHVISRQCVQNQCLRLRVLRVRRHHRAQGKICNLFGIIWLCLHLVYFCFLILVSIVTFFTTFFSSSSSESEAENQTKSGQKRRLTRSRLRHSPKVGSEKVPTVKREKSPRQKTGKAAAKSSADEDALVVNRQCPVKGCNSQGHMSGLATHFLQESCPFYHNISGKSGNDDPQRLRERFNADRARLERFDDPNDYKEFLAKRRRNGRNTESGLIPGAG